MSSNSIVFEPNIVPFIVSVPSTNRSLVTLAIDIEVPGLNVSDAES